MKGNNIKTNIPPIKAIQAFERAAALGSIVKASESLNVTTSAVSHQIASLEKFLGKKVFYRNGRGIVLTKVGEQYLEAISGALHTISVATSNIINHQNKEIFRIHASPSFGLLYLLPRIESFKKSHPELQIDLTCSYEDAQFNLDQIDVDIRHGHFPWKSLDVIPIKNEIMSVFASPAYLAKHPINHPKELLTKNLILSESTLVQWEQWFSYHHVDLSKGFNYAFSFDRSYMSFESAKQGLGFILESELLVEQFIEQKTLIPVFNRDFSIPINAHCLVFPHTHKKFSKIRAFIEWFKNELKIV